MALPAIRKHFIPLESNPVVFTELIHKLGVSTELCFEDVLSLDDTELLSFLARPAFALILVFPTTEAYRERVREADKDVSEDQAVNENGPVRFFRQTINNACGLYAILHAVCNGPARDKLVPGSIITRLEQCCSSLGLSDCARALEHDAELEQAYAEVARTGDTAAPDNVEEEVDFHYLCFVKSHVDNELYQLDGDRIQPINLGPIPADEDVLSDRCRSVVREMVAQEEGNLNFNLLALVPAAT